jgi:CheY-like chemotaxis protein
MPISPQTLRRYLFVTSACVSVTAAVAVFTAIWAADIYSPNGVRAMWDWWDTTLLILLVTTALVVSASIAELASRAIRSALANSIRQMTAEVPSDPAPVSEFKELATLDANSLSLLQKMAELQTRQHGAENLRKNYVQMFSILVSSFKSRLTADSPLLRDVNDYAILLQTENVGDLTGPKRFDLSILMKSAVTAARKEIAVTDKVKLVTTLEATAPRHWSGHPDLIEALIRHLLLIALRRSASGGVTLRLEADAKVGMQGRHWLRIKLEDSGAPLQRTQLRQWLEQIENGVPAMGSDSHDFSWILTGRLFKHLGGGASAEMGPNGGLYMIGWIPLSLPEHGVSTLSPVPHMVEPAMNSRDFPVKVVMVVESNQKRQQELQGLLSSSSCDVFIVENHTEALEWAAVLPLAALIVNTTLSDANTLIMQRMRSMSEEGIISKIPMLAISSDATPAARRPWIEAGIDEFIEIPFRAESIQQLRQILQPPDAGFYCNFNSQQRGDLPETVIQRMPELTGQLADYIKNLELSLVATPNGSQPVNIRHEAHAIKSSALSLGYLRLAALMGQVEHTVRSTAAASANNNWRVIEKCLHYASLAHP